MCDALSLALRLEAAADNFRQLRVLQIRGFPGHVPNRTKCPIDTVPNGHDTGSVNLGIRNLRAAAGEEASIEDIARELGVDRTYCGRVLSGKRPASLAIRQSARDKYGVSLEDWDQEIPDSEQPQDNGAKPSSSLG